MSLDGAALVTGGTRGIGKAIALRLAREGATRIALGYFRNDNAAEETAEEVRAAGAEPVLVRGNVSSERTLEQFATAGPYRARSPTTSRRSCPAARCPRCPPAR